MAGQQVAVVLELARIQKPAVELGPVSNHEMVAELGQVNTPRMAVAQERVSIQKPIAATVPVSIHETVVAPGLVSTQIEFAPEPEYTQ